MFWLSLAIQIVIASSFPLIVWGYIPAAPANTTIGGTGLDVHDNSSLALTWQGNGIYGTGISYQQMGNGSMGISKGALILIQENDIVNNDTTLTPWIAFINCDRNITNTDMGTDIFTMVQQKGAIAALLYSNTSEGCLMNDEYLNGEFDALFDIFTTKSAATAKVIQSQYQHVNWTHAKFNSGLLNDSFSSVVDALPRDSHNNSPYLVATLRSYNAPVEDPADPNPVPTSPVKPQSNSNSQNPALIILYVIVSIVSALFVIVILSGAIRAFRHPERYGPRLYHPGMDGEESQPQTRAAGITRAILDTFPVVKFGSSNESATTVSNVNFVQDHEMKNCNRDAVNKSNSNSNEFLHAQPQFEAPSNDSHAERTLARSSVEAQQSLLKSQTRVTELAGTTSPSDIDPAAIGTETCPICIVDFEDGDDLRVLPCDEKHRFHKDCVDPWLLELSSSCPICREDFQALETMAVAAGTETQEQEETEDRFPPEQSLHSSTAGSRFARYMRFAQRRRRSQRDSNTSSRNAAPVSPLYTDY